MARGQDGSLLLFLYDSFIHYFTPVYPDAIQANRLPSAKNSTQKNRSHAAWRVYTTGAAAAISLSAVSNFRKFLLKRALKSAAARS